MFSESVELKGKEGRAFIYISFESKRPVIIVAAFSSPFFSSFFFFFIFLFLFFTTHVKSYLYAASILWFSI